MRAWLIGFTLVQPLCGLLPVLPEAPAVRLYLPAALVLLCLLSLPLRRLRLVSGICAGLALAIGALALALERRLADCVDQPERWLLIRVLEVSRAGSDFQRFEGRVLQDLSKPDSRCRSVAGTRLRLAWYRGERPAAGERWRLRVRLRPPWGSVNPGGFDYERWLLGAGLDGTGTVRGGQRQAPVMALPPFPRSLENLRNHLRARLEPYDGHGLFRALALGDSAGLSTATWELLRATGTVHLLVVSGLHVGLATALGYGLGGWLGRAWPGLCLSWGVRLPALLGAMVVSGLFVLLAGADPPALRAWMMSAVAGCALARGRTLDPWAVWWLALGFVLALQPLAWLQPGLWLSFGAVAALIRRFGGGREAPASFFRTLWLVQVALTLGLTPLLALGDGSVPAAAAGINLIAVPFVTAVLLPLTLMTLALPADLTWPGLLLQGAGELLLLILRGTSALPLLQASGTAGWLLMPGLWVTWRLLGGVPGHRLPLLLLIWSLWLAPRSASIPEGTFQITVLDVGQGTAVVVDTARHRLLYDTGPGYPGGFNTGERVLLPALRTAGAVRADVLLLSHGDRDHVGGADAVAEATRPARLLVGAGLDQGEPCRAGQQWIWDEVTFSIVHPVRSRGLSKNNGSCVLYIQSSTATALLTGDIERSGERSVLRRIDGPVTLLIAPHHGSRTSSGRRFVQRLQPALVVMTAPRFSPYGHPHPEVLARYLMAGANVVVTGRRGALRWTSDQPARITGWRQERPRLWRRQLPPLPAPPGEFR